LNRSPVNSGYRNAQRYGLKNETLEVIGKEGEDVMVNRKLVYPALLLFAVGPMATGASAITADVAKKCETLMAKAFPPRQAGNPAAGSAKGTAQDQRAYFNRCVTNGGKVDDDGSKETK
jgi:hypothetical protein